MVEVSSPKVVAKVSIPTGLPLYWTINASNSLLSVAFKPMSSISKLFKAVLVISKSILPSPKTNA